MNKLYITLLLLVFCPFCLTAQITAFQEFFTINDAPVKGEAIVSTNDNGFAIAGSINIAGNVESFLTKFNSNGVSEWTKVYYDQLSHVITSGVNDTEIYCSQFPVFLLQTTDNGYILGGGVDSAVLITYPNGVTVGSDFFRMYLIKTDDAGDVVWTKKYGRNDFDGAAAILEDTENGGYYVAAYAHQDGSVSSDDLLIRLHSDGEIAWTKSFGGTNSEGASDLKKSGDGNLIFCGTSESFSNNQNIYVVKLDTTGNILWSNVYGTTGFDYGRSVLQSQDGGYFIYGNAGNGNPSYIALIKTDAAGNVQWANTYGDFFLDGPVQLDYAPDGNLMALVDHYTGQYDGLIIRIDTSGNPLSDRVFGNAGIYTDDFITSFIPWQNSFVFTGSTNAYSTNSLTFYGYLVKPTSTLFTDCYADSVSADPTPLALTVTNAGSATADVYMSVYPMLITPMDSNFIGDTLCALVYTSSPPGMVSDNSIFISPVPASDEIHFHSQQPITFVEIYNALGERISNQKFSLADEASINVSAWSPGVYIARISTANGMALKRFSIVQ